MSPRWEKRLRLPKSEGGATICEKHDFIASHFLDPEMSWEVDQALTQAKDDGKRMEARIQELGEEANNLEDALKEAESDRDRLASDLQATRAELERVRRNHLHRMAHTAWLRRDYPRSTPISFRRRGQYDRFAMACNRAALAAMEPKA